MSFRTGFFIFFIMMAMTITVRIYATEYELTYVSLADVAALAALSLFLTAFAFWRLWHVQQKLNDLQKGLHQFERHINERVDAIPHQPHHDLLRRSSLPLPQAIRTTDTFPSPDEPGQAHFDFEPLSYHRKNDESDNVIPFLRLVQDEEEKRPEKPAKGYSFDKASFHLRLQPIIHLQSRKTAAFMIVPGFTAKEDTFVTLETAKAELGSAFSNASCDFQLVQSAVALLKSLTPLPDEAVFYLPLRAQPKIKLSDFSGL